jgi:hypothetical protein
MLQGSLSLVGWLFIDLHLKPPPGGMHFAQVLLNKGERWQPCLSRTDQANAFWVYSEEVGPDLQAHTTHHGCYGARQDCDIMGNV